MKKYLVRAYLLDGCVFEDTIEAENKRDAIGEFLDLYEDDLMDHGIDCIEAKQKRQKRGRR